MYKPLETAVPLLTQICLFYDISKKKWLKDGGYCFSAKICVVSTYAFFPLKLELLLNFGFKFTPWFYIINLFHVGNFQYRMFITQLPGFLGVVFHNGF